MAFLWWLFVKKKQESKKERKHALDQESKIHKKMITIKKEKEGN